MLCLINNKIYRLSDIFYNAYSHHPEILKKNDRPYCIATITIEGIRFAIPFRTNIRHPYAHIFRNSKRSDNAGLDFSKAVVINDDKYIGIEAIIDSDEYSLFIKDIKIISNRFAKFIKNYRIWALNPVYHKKESLMNMTSLQYFHQEIGIL